MLKSMIRLMRKINHLRPPGKNRVGRMTVFFVMLVLLTACRPVPTIQTSLTSHSSTGTIETSPGITSSQNLTSASSEALSSSSISGSASESSSETSESQTDTQISDSSSDLTPSLTAPIDTTLPIIAETTAKATTRKPTATPTSRPASTPTSRPTSTPTLTPTAASANFPYKNYGTFFRDNYGQNSNIIQSEDGGISIDIGCAAYGVALVKIDGIPADKRCKVIATGNSKSYNYDIPSRGTYMGIPLQNGNGSYTITVYEQVSGTSYTTKMAHTFTVTLASSLKPFTAASVMVDFSSGSACVTKAKSLCSGISTSTGRVDAVYRWIVDNITYDRALADSITSGQVTTYIPNPDNTYSTKKGICFDFAALMCAMLRSQGIPTRLIVGQTSLGYHAWNEVYFEGQGWVVVASFQWQEISGSGWVMFDTTFAAGGMSPTTIQGTPHTKQKTY